MENAFAVALCALASCAAAERTLSLVHAVWRHGDRSPATLIPTDEGNPETSWPQGLGELTEEGMREHFALGRWVRQLYGAPGGSVAPLLSANYSAFELHVQSTSYNRTIMSAMANLAGLYGDGGQAFREGLPWAPVPVHSRPKAEDPLLYEQYPCPVEDDYYHNVIQHWPEVEAIMSEHAALLDLARRESGLELATLGDVYALFDPLHCEAAHKDDHPWPSWVNESVFAEITDLHDASTRYYCPNDKAKKLRGGVLVTDIIDRMQQRRDGTLDPRLKYQVYSAHDTTLIVLLSTLGVFNGRNPPYASAVFVELWQEESGSYSVVLRLRNATATEAGPAEGHLLNVPGCAANPCPLDDFADLYRKFKVEPDEVDSLCRGEGPAARALGRLSDAAWLAIVGVLSALVLGLAVAVAVLGYERLRGRDGGRSGPAYSRLPVNGDPAADDLA